MIERISFDEIFTIWQNQLWPNRKSKIESNSAMLFLGEYTLENFNYKPTFFAFKKDNRIAGVNSGHRCYDNSYRSRGLYVFPEFRNLGIGTLLLKETINQGILENAKFVWSLPRKESWSAYNKAGFSLSSEWHDTETGLNAYCKRDL
jgi:GNAT superfamily N-acetyltransferase